MDHREEALFEAFALSNRKGRYMALLATKRGRDKVLFSLDHFHDLDPRFCKQVAASEQNPAGVLSLLQSFGAPPLCYVISSWSEVDRREMPLADALAAIIGRGMGTFISCLPGTLAYFEGEDPKHRFICHRDRSTR
jgi:hypothetical protein